MTSMEFVGHVQFTVDTALVNGPSEEAIDGCQRMLKRFADAGVAATWAIDINHRPLIDRLLAMQQPVEMALQVPPLLIHLPTDRVRFERWLVASLHELRPQSVEIASLYVPHGDVADVSDILVGNGIRLVSMPVRHTRRLSDSPRLLRPGLIRVPLTTTVPGRGRLLGAWDPAYRAKAALSHAMRRQSSQQIVVSMDHILAAGAQGWRSLESVLQLTRLGTEAGTLHCETLQEATMRLMPISVRKPMQSILRAA